MPNTKALDIKNEIIPLHASEHGSEKLLLIQKSLPMLSLWRSPLTLAEFKILDLYLSKIDSHNPEQRWVRFHKGELERLLGVDRIRIDDLKERMRHLCITVEIPNASRRGGFDAIALFERAICTPAEDGTWLVDLQCTPSAMQYIFNIENIGYIRYRLRAICSLTSRYSYILFLYLEQNRFRISWTEDLEILRKMLGCDQKYYDSFKRFNQKILQRCQKELAQKTNCRFTYTTLKKGRSVYSIEFTISPADSVEKALLLTEPDDQTKKNPKLNDLLDLLESACCLPGTGKPEFSKAEVYHLLQWIRQIPKEDLPQQAPGEDWGLAMYHYLAERYAAMHQKDEKEHLRSRIAYLIGMIKKDVGV